MSEPNPKEVTTAAISSEQFRRYVLLPVGFLTVTFLGGMRIMAADSSFLFVRPSLIHLIFGLALVALLLRSSKFDNFFAGNASILQNCADVLLLAVLYAASVQTFNSLIPESGFQFWVVTFCFAWSLWNIAFAQLKFDRLYKSLIAFFTFAFVAKYIVIAELATTSSSDSGWLRSIVENPVRGTVTWLLELPRFSGSTGYIQFLSLLLFFIGLFFLPRRSE